MFEYGVTLYFISGNKSFVIIIVRCELSVLASGGTMNEFKSNRLEKCVG